VKRLVPASTADPLRRRHLTYLVPSRIEVMRIVGTADMADSLQNFRDGVTSHEAAAGPKESSKDWRTSACARDCAPPTHDHQDQACANHTADR
jgi:hypothetical protein